MEGGEERAWPLIMASCPDKRAVNNPHRMRDLPPDRAPGPEEVAGRTRREIRPLLDSDAKPDQPRAAQALARSSAWGAVARLPAAEFPWQCRPLIGLILLCPLLR